MDNYCSNAPKVMASNKVSATTERNTYGLKKEKLYSNEIETKVAVIAAVNTPRKRGRPRIKRVIDDVVNSELPSSQKENYPASSLQTKKLRTHKIEALRENESNKIKALKNADDDYLGIKRQELTLMPKNSSTIIEEEKNNKENELQCSAAQKKDLISCNIDSLAPDLKNLILQPKSRKIRRPPNAFMLFAKDQRHHIQTENRESNNRKVSVLLGNMWRNMKEEDRKKYYHQAEALEELHKKTYPDYVYIPAQARLTKKRKISKNATFISPISNVENGTAINGLPFLSNSDSIFKKADYSMKEKVLKNEFGNSEGENICNGQTLLYPPLWNDVQRNWTKYQTTTTLSQNSFNVCNSQPNQKYEMCAPCMHHIHSDGAVKEAPYKMSSSLSPYSFPGMFPNYYHPGIWNPWLMGPTLYNPPTPRPLPAEFLRNWMRPSVFPLNSHEPLQLEHQNLEILNRSRQQVPTSQDGFLKYSSNEDLTPDDIEQIVQKSVDSDDTGSLIIVDGGSDDGIN